MGGIFGYIGNDECKDILAAGLECLEKRGGEITGIAMKNADDIFAVKTVGNTQDLKQKLSKIDNPSTVGIAQCDKAVRCKASPLTAKPASNNMFAIAMDGYVDNFDDLKRWSANPFPIATDEDLLLAMLCVLNQNEKIQIISKISSMISSTPSFVFFGNDADVLYCHAGTYPLLIGIGENGFYVSSELNSLTRLCSKYTSLDFGESARITKSKLTVYDGKMRKIKKILLSTPEEIQFENNYPFKDEIFYCPLAVKETYKNFVHNSRLDFDDLKLTRRSVEKIKRIILTGSGSSYNVAKISAYNFEMLTDIPTVAYEAGELRYSGCIIDKNTLMIAISHRGENDNTIACVRRAKSLGAKAICLTSNKSSTLARISDKIINPNCDFDVSDISFRSYISNYLAMSFFTLYMGYKNNVVNELYLNVTIKMAEMLSGKVFSSVKSSIAFESIADILSTCRSVYVTGLGADYALTLEGAQKLQQVSSIEAIAYPVCRLSQIPADMLNDKVVLALITNKEFLQKSLYDLRRIKNLGARVMIITTSNIEEEIKDFESILAFNDSIPLFNPLTCICSIYKIAVLVEEIKSKPHIDEAV